MLFISPVTFGGQYCSMLGAARGLPCWFRHGFRADSGINLIKQGDNVIGLLCGHIAQWVQVPVRSCAFSYHDI